MEKCKKCGAADDWACFDRVDTNMGYSERVESRGCLARQLAAAQKAVDFERKMVANESAKLSATRDQLKDSARLATESAQLADGLAKDLAAANERAGRLEEALKDAIEHVAGSHIGHYGYHTAYCDITVRPERLTAWVEALEVPDAL